MKLILFLILSSYIFANYQGELKDNFYASGKIILDEGDSYDNAYIIWYRQRLIDPIYYKVKVNNDGSFHIKFPDNNLYVIKYCVPRYQKFGTYLNFGLKPYYEFNIKLEKQYKSTTNKYFVMIKNDNVGFREKKKIPLKAYGDYFSADIDTINKKNPLFEYTIVVDENKEIESNSFTSKLSNSGSTFYSVEQIKNGKVKIIFDPKILIESKKKPELIPLKNMIGYNVNNEIYNFFNRYSDLIHAKYEKKDNTYFGLETVLDSIRNLYSTLTDSNDLALGIFIATIDIPNSSEYLKDDLNKAIKYAINHEELMNEQSVFYTVRDYLFKIDTSLNKSVIDSLYAIKIINFNTDLQSNPKYNSDYKMTYLEEVYWYLKDIDPKKAQAFASEYVSKYSMYYPSKSIASEIKHIKMAQKKAPNFSYPNIANKMTSLSDFKGKYVLLDLWATWCGPCIEELPNISNVYAQLDKNKIEIISVCVDKAGDILKKFVTDRNYNWTFLGGGKNWDESILKDYSVSFLPTVFLINPQGEIVTSEGLRGKELLPTLNKFLK